MKLPENKEDRLKILMLAGLFGAGALFALYYFAVQPFMEDMRTRRQRVEELDDLIWRAKSDLDTMERNRRRNADTVSDILQASEIDHHILRPSLGNYLLVASDILTGNTTGLQLTVESTSELGGPRGLLARQDTKPNDPRFAPYTVNLSLTGGIHDLIRYLNRLETENPYLSIVRLVIMEQSDINPEMHLINIHVQWPIWRDAEHPRRLAAERLADEEQQ